MNCCAHYREKLEAAQLDELSDAGFYAQIAEEAPTKELRELLVSIAGDEYGHARMLAALIGFCPPCPSCPEECPKATGDFCKDVQTAMEGELEAIKSYSQLAGCAPSMKIRSLLASILGDEYAHVRILSAMLEAKCLCAPHPCEKDPCKEKPGRDQPCKEQPCKETPVWEQPCKEYPCQERPCREMPCKPCQD